MKTTQSWEDLPFQCAVDPLYGQISEKTFRLGSSVKDGTLHANTQFEDLPSGKHSQFAIDNGSVEIVD